MTNIPRRPARPAQAFIALFAFFTLFLLGGCASFHVDGTAGEPPPDGYRRPEVPQPVQMLFEFRTKGVPNDRATAALGAKVMEHVTTSGLFSAVDGKPVPGDRFLSITIDNVPVTDDAFRKGFVTGLTLGLAGSVVTDGYVCTLVYRARPDAAPIEKRARHAIHTSLGAAAAPPNATRAKNIDAAVTTMTRQLVGRALQDLSIDPDFR